MEIEEKKSKSTTSKSTPAKSGTTKSTPAKKTAKKAETTELKIEAEKKKTKTTEKKNPVLVAVVFIVIGLVWSLVTILLAAIATTFIAIGLVGSLLLVVGAVLVTHAKLTFAKRKEAAAMTGKKQPAKIAPFFRGGITLRLVFVGAFKEYVKTLRVFADFLRRACADFASAFKDAVKVFPSNVDKAPDMLRLFVPILRIGFFLGCIASYAVFAIFFSLAVFLVHFVLLAIYFSIGFVFYFLLLFLDTLYCRIKQIATHCNACQHKYGFAVYICPGCNIEHTRLRPGRYGIFRRKCQCGQKLATTFFTGRHKIKATCPFCKAEENNSLHSSVCIPVVGGPSAGKTCFINMALANIEENSLADFNLQFEYISSDNDAFRTNSAKFAKGQLPIKTSDTRLNYYRFYLSKPKAKVKNMIAVCDVAGEVYANEREMSGQIAFSNATAYLMVIDPLSIAEYRRELSKKGVDPKPYGYSVKPLDEILGMLMTTIQSMLNLSRKDVFTIDLAVVFTKGDIPGLDKHIGNIGIRDYIHKHPKVGYYDAQNIVCEEFLKKYGETNFLNSLHSKFKSVQFFTVSALGKNADGKKFAPQSPELPVLWLLNKSRKIFKLGKKLKKKV